MCNTCRAEACAGLGAVEAVLRERGLLTEGVRWELLAGQQYWREERRLCALMRRRPTVPPGGHADDCGFTADEVLAASAAKSFDYRLLNHLLYALRGVQPDEAALAFLRADELLVDMGDDFLDYEDDITAAGGGSFNLLRCFVHLYGEAAEGEGEGALQWQVPPLVLDEAAFRRQFG